MKWLRKYWWLVLIVVPGGVALLAGGKVLKLIRHFTTRGRQVNASWPYNKNTGTVEADPQALADEAGVSLEQHALATMLSSEVGDEAEDVKVAHAWVAVNYSRDTGQTIVATLLTAKNKSHTGYYGSQGDLETTNSSGRHPSDRYASTRLAPHEDDIGIAGNVMSGAVPDPTQGATQFDNPSLEDKLFAAGKTSVDGAGLGAKRESEGKVAVYVDGLDPTKFRFWRKA